MAASSAAGSTLAISMALPATNDATGFAALGFTEIGGVEKIGTVGASYEKTEFKPFQGAKQKYKGSVDYGALQPSLAHDEADAGQSMLRIAAEDQTNRLFAFLVTFPTGAKRFLQARVFGYPETADGADTMLMVTPTIEICANPVKVAPGPITPTPAPAFSGKPTVSPTSGDTSTTYTATDPTVANGTITARAWLLGTTVIGTGPSIVPGVGNDGQLSRKVTAVGTDGSTITTTSTAVTVTAISTSPTQDNTIAGDTSNKAGNAAWQSRYQSLETRFTALGVA